MFEFLKNKIKNRLSGFVKAEIESTIEYLVPQTIEFENSTIQDRQSYHDHTKDTVANAQGYYAGLKDRLVYAGIPVEEVRLDVNDFETWLISFPEMKKYYSISLGDLFIEKCLEHYLTFHYLKISKSEVYIDIAAFQLDLVYPKGIHGIKIGADAGNTGLPDGFCSAMSAQCAYECFMGDSDYRFVEEANRILSTKGRYAIVPLYLDDTAFEMTSPFCDQKMINIDSGFRKVWRDDGHKVPFSRHYSPESFKERIYSRIPVGMVGKIFYFKNLIDIAKRHEGQRIYCNFMFYCEKNK